MRYYEFVRRRRWVPASEPGKERDKYDIAPGKVLHVGVVAAHSGNVVCSARLLLHGGMMIQDPACELSELTKNYVIPPTAVEVSRLCTVPEESEERLSFLERGNVQVFLFFVVLRVMEVLHFDPLLAVVNDVPKDLKRSGRVARYADYEFFTARFRSFQPVGVTKVFETVDETEIATMLIEISRSGYAEGLKKFEHLVKML